MKANELMLGDWVMTQRFIDGNPCLDVCIQVTVQTLDDLESGVDEVTPIPLTSEILEKNGFENKADYEWSLRISNHYVIYNRNYNPTISIGKIDKIDLDDEEVDYESVIYFEETPYVHELQHALRLCGLNDLANNFKV